MKLRNLSLRPQYWEGDKFMINKGHSFFVACGSLILYKNVEDREKRKDLLILRAFLTSLKTATK